MQDNIIVNNEITYSFELEDKEIRLNGEPVKIDLQSIRDDSSYHIIYQHKTYRVEVLSMDIDNKVVELEVNGQAFHVKTQDPYDTLLQQMGISQHNKNGILALKAPMPGLVLDIFITAGDQVAKGENLLILEAMKMENIIKSPDDLRIKSVEVQKGQSVEKNQVLLTFDSSL